MRAIAGSSPLEHLPEGVSAKAVVYGALARNVLGHILMEPIEEVVAGSRATTITGVMAAVRMALHGEVARALYRTDEGVLDGLNARRPTHRGCPVAGVTRNSLTTGADAGVFAVATTLHTIGEAVNVGQARVTRMGLDASVRVPKAQARQSLAGLEQSWARLAVPLDNPGPADGTSRALRSGTYTLDPVRGIFLHGMAAGTVVQEPGNPVLGCPALVVPLIRNLHAVAVGALVGRGIIVPADS